MRRILSRGLTSDGLSDKVEPINLREPAMQTLFSLQRATLAARQRLSDASIGTQVARGLVQVCRVTYPNGPRAAVKPVSGFMPAADAVVYLDRM